MMDQDTILEILGGGGPEIEVLKENLDQVAAFLELAGTLDKLPQMDRRVSEDGVSLYHAISKEKEMATLEAALTGFFGEPIKKAGAPLSSDLTDNLTINYLGGVKQDQALFLKRIGQSELYGALFPWQRKVNVITVHLGLYNPVMPDDDYKRLEKLVAETIAQQVSEEVENGLAGQVQGISLPSFLQMSEMEGSTCSLRIRSGDKSGMLHLLNGNLIDAETDDLNHKDAAYAILGWDSPTIEILKTVGRTKNEIGLPLMHLLMDSLRQKDQREFEKDAPPEKALEKKTLKKEVQKLERKKAYPAEEPAEKARGRAFEKPPSMSAKQKMPHVRGESGREEVVLERENTGNQAAAPVEKPPSEPRKKEPEADVSIDKSLIQEHAPRHSKRRKAGKSAMDLKLSKKIVMVAVLALLILCAAGYFIFQGIKGEGAGDSFERLMAKVEQLTDADVQEKLLMDFINAHEPGEDTARAEIKLQEIWRQNEEDNYQKTIDAVNKLPIDQVFEKSAKALYSRFLEKYPNSRYTEDIQQAVSEISGLSEDIVFSSLKNMGGKNYIEKIDSCTNYLSLFPQGKHRDIVKRMFSETLGESYIDFKKEIAECERNAMWDACLTLCEDYLEAFSDYLDTREVKTIQDRIQMQKDYSVLQAQVQGLDDDTVRRRYMAFMTANPDSPNNEEIKTHLQKMDQHVTEERQWTSLKKSIQGSGLSLQERIDKIERYIFQNSSGRYIAEAREILISLREESDMHSVEPEQPIKSLGSEGKAEKEADEQYAALAKRRAEADRLNRKKQEAIAALEETKGRFVLSGDSAVMDQKTGLMWSLIDSWQEQGVCMDHRSARRYVNELRYNGHDDWRLPTSAELAGIYKNEPYFPDSGARWYWTSEIFAKGYSYIVNTVSAKQETVFKKVTHDVEACGTVRAIRP
jgi:hypothetical protein